MTKLKDQILELSQTNLSQRQIASQLNCNKSTVRYYLDDNYRSKMQEKANKRRKPKKNIIRNKIKFCKKCKIELNKNNLFFKTGKFCNNCNINYIDWSKITLKEFKLRFKNKANFNGRMRSLSRQKFKNKKCKCSNCEFIKFTEICHIKAISDFSDDSLISEINDLSNLIQLCPNCHWQFDHDLEFKENVLSSYALESTKF